MHAVHRHTENTNHTNKINLINKSHDKMERQWMNNSKVEKSHKE